MKARHLALPLALLCASVSASEFFVAPGGNDANPGTSQKPFASFQRGQAAARAERKAHPEQGISVIFRAGVYRLDQTMRFTAEDSGASADRPVRYLAPRGESVTISGGKLVTGWQPDTQRPGLWKTRLPEPAGGDAKAWQFEQLWINGERAMRARTPNYWEFGAINSVTEDPPTDGSVLQRHTFVVRPELLAALGHLDPAALQRVQVVVFHKWDTTREWLESVSPGGVFTTRGAKMQSWNRMERDSLFYFENALTPLDNPGEWFLDQDRWLYYRPRPGEDLKRAEVIAPELERFLSFQGVPEKADQWVQHISFEGLKFRYAEFHVPQAGLPPGQAAMNVDATAIQLDAARDIRFTDCAVEHIGSTAFWFRHACRDCRVEHTRMFDLGIGGVRIGEPNIVPEPVRTGGITIDNCIIQSGGRIMPHTVAVWIGQSSDNILAHCDVSDWFYTAVSVGWRWGYDESAAKRNRIEYNRLHHLGYRILSDMGGVYMLGPSEGTVVRNNVIHDVYATRYGGWGLYPDEGSTGILYENNLVYDVRDGCVHQHYGKENVFRNNILAFSEEGQIALTRAEPHLSFTFETNIVYWDDGHLLGYAGWRNGAKVILRNNLYWRAGGKPFDCDGKSWDEWRAKGNDAGSLVADPLFVNPGLRDFRLRPGSPAGKIGFKPFDFTEAGVRGDTAWRKLAASIEFPKPYIVPPPEPVDVHDDFEHATLTPLLSVATLSDEGHPELITVTDSVAASGKHSLKIQDRPDLKEVWNPHLYWDPFYTKGQAHLTFKIRLEPGADAVCEWRDRGNPFHAGPSMRFQNNAAWSRGQKLMDVPENAWIGVEMRSPLGQPNSHWQLKLTLPDETTRAFKDLGSDPAWKEIRWVGFSSLASSNVAFYLDDVEMENR